jgi:hypothetical protein
VDDTQDTEALVGGVSVYLGADQRSAASQLIGEASDCDQGSKQRDARTQRRSAQPVLSQIDPNHSG